MSEYFILGINHKTAPVEIRERVAYSRDTIEATCRKILELPSIEEVIVLSTCNRTELITYANDSDRAETDLLKFLMDDKGMAEYDKSWFYIQRNLNDVAKHVFLVAAGLDSMIIGELQITGQMKNAYELSIKAGTSGSALNFLIQHAFKTVKAIRNNTDISEGFVSVGSAAAVLAEKILGDLRKRTALIIGAGEISEITAKNLVKKGIDSVNVINRTFSRGKTLAEKLGGTVHDFSKLSEIMVKTDIIISSTGSNGFIINSEMLKKIMKERWKRPIFLIDLSVPRDIEPGAANLPDVYISDIDDLELVTETNLEYRKKGAEKANKIIDEEVRKFSQKMRLRCLNPIIESIQNSAYEIKENEISAFMKKSRINDKKLEKDIDHMTDRIIKKILHQQIITVRKMTLDDSRGNNYLNFIKTIFNLE